MKTIATLIFILVTSPIFSQVSGDDYLGTWKNKDRYFPVEIEWSEGKFLIHEKEHTLVGRLIDGCLVSNTGMGSSEICYMPSGDHILVNGISYLRTTKKLVGVVPAGLSANKSEAQSGVSPFLGSWKNPGRAFPIRIYEEDDKVIVEEKEAKLVGRLEKGAIISHTGMGKSEISYLKSEDAILVNGIKYLRATPAKASGKEQASPPTKNLDERLQAKEGEVVEQLQEAYLVAENAPFHGSLHVLFTQPKVLCEECNPAEINLLANSIFKGFSKSKRFANGSRNTFPETGMNCTISVVEISYSLKEGKLIPSGVPYQGYKMTAEVHIEFSDKDHPEPKGVSYLVKGGDPGKNHSRKEAFIALTKSVERQVARLSYSLFQVECNYEGIEEKSRKGKIKKIRLASDVPLFPQVKVKEYKFIAVVPNAGENDRIEEDEILGEFQVTSEKDGFLIAKLIKGEERFRTALSAKEKMVFMSRLSSN